MPGKWLAGDRRDRDGPGRPLPESWWSAANGSPVDRARGPTIAASASRLTPSESSRLLVPPPADAPAAPAITITISLAAMSVIHSPAVTGR